MEYYSTLVQTESMLLLIVALSGIATTATYYTDPRRKLFAKLGILSVLLFLAIHVGKQILSISATGSLDEIWKFFMVIAYALVMVGEGLLKTRFIQISDGTNVWHLCLGEIRLLNYPKIGDSFTIPGQDIPAIVTAAATHSPFGQKMDIPIFMIKYSMLELKRTNK